jgi:hypothetical protein
MAYGSVKVDSIVTTTKTLTVDNLLDTSVVDQTLISPVLTVAPVLTGAPFVDGSYRSNITAVAALDIDCSLGNYFTKTITEASTFTFSNVPASRSYSFTLCVVHDSGTITWPGSVKWPQNVAPVLTTYRTHKFMFSTYTGGSIWYGAVLSNYSY